ncbi:MAG: prolyl oligopeptidase family serine peptidase [Gemmatimonadetes bacterium]|nr:prolyl oligopeptidase family serine peptidase [Gemmatimonadota bacterium]
MMLPMMIRRTLLLSLTLAAPLLAQRGFQGTMDSVRLRQLYISNDPKDLPGGSYAQQISQKNRTDSIWFARFKGLVDVKKITYASRADGLTIPAYIFAPINKRGNNGHAAMIWVHQGIHANWDESLLPFVKEAVDKGYVLITPEYRGSTGFGEAFYRAQDYGGYEVVDVISAMDYLKTLPYVDMGRVGMMGWSHGGYITMLNATTAGHGLKAAASLVPVTDLFFRLSLKGPGYIQNFSAMARMGGAPFEKVEEYIKRSPVYQVEKLDIPMLVHVSTNDLDVNFVEDQQMVWKLKALKPDLAETKIYVDPPGWGGTVGHAFDRRVDPVTLQRLDTPEQIDSWNRIWQFFDWNLRPSEDKSKPPVPPRVQP